MKLIGNKILVRKLKDDGIASKGGIFIPDTAHKRFITAEVIQVGTKVKEDIKVGDKIPIPHGVGIECDLEKLGGDLIITNIDSHTVGVCM